MLLAILFCILKNNASGYPATGTAVDIIDTIGLYRENAIAIESEARDPFGGNVYYAHNANYVPHSGICA